MKKTILLWMVMPFIFLACGGSDLPEDYTVPEARILAVRIEDPEAKPGDSVSMRLLMAGKTIDQTMFDGVEWFLNADPPIFLGTSPYQEDFVAEIPIDLLADDEDHADIQILAKMTLGNKSFVAEKKLRITHHPLAKNPVITEVEVRYKNGAELVKEIVGNGEAIFTGNQTGAVAFVAHTAELAEGENDELVYRWYASDAKVGINRIYAYEDKDLTEELLGEGTETGEGNRSVVFSLKGDENDGNLENGVYDVYLVVRDNAANSQGSQEDRFGTDFMYFTLCVNTNG